MTKSHICLVAFGILLSATQYASAAGKFDSFCDMKSNKLNFRLASCSDNSDAANQAGNQSNPTPGSRPTREPPKTSHPGGSFGNQTFDSKKQPVGQ